MSNLEIGIGLTTYLRIGTREFGEAVYDAHAAVSSKITPNRMGVWKFAPISSRAEFGSLWSNEATFETYESSKKGAPRLDRTQTLVGGRWKRVAGIAGRGRVDFPPHVDPNCSSRVLISYQYEPKIDWLLLFRKLVAFLQPSHAMLHLFPLDFDRCPPDTHQIERFEGPVAGEMHFISWKTGLGTWRTPDPWQLEERRRYRFLPQLAFANVLGPEFDGCYREPVLNQLAPRFEKVEGRVVFQVIEGIDDLVSNPGSFIANRGLIRRAFEPGVFRTP